MKQQHPGLEAAHFLNDNPSSSYYMFLVFLIFTEIPDPLTSAARALGKPLAWPGPPVVCSAKQQVLKNRLTPIIWYHHRIPVQLKRI